jgi:CSLREA domain-containing protein
VNDPAVGACNSSCTLREAIVAANGHTGADVVVLTQPTYRLTRPGAGEDSSKTGDLDVTDDLELQGRGAGRTAIAGDWGSGPDRLLEIPDPGVTLGASGLTLRDASLTDPNLFGGAIAAQPDTVLKLSDARVTANEAPSYAGIALAEARATITRTRFDHNSGATAPALASLGGSSAILREVSFSANHAINDSIGAVYDLGFDMTLKNVTFDRNTADGYAGAMLIISGVASLENVTFSGNRAKFEAGALYVTSSPPVLLNNVTIAGNVADSDANGSGDGGGLYDSTDGGSVSLQNSIVAGNADGGNQAPDCFSTHSLDSNGFNLIGDTTGCSFATHAGDLKNVAPALAALADNGGFTETRALEGGSPAIDHGSNKSATKCAPRDQRGEPRHGRCDIGAYERQ